jgi:hypothetical protein
MSTLFTLDSSSNWSNAKKSCEPVDISPRVFQIRRPEDEDLHALVEREHPRELVDRVELHALVDHEDVGG